MPSIVHVVIMFSVIFSLLFLVAMFRIWASQRKYTRTKFAFTALSSFLLLSLATIGSVAANTTPWDIIHFIVYSQISQNAKLSSPRVIDYIFQLAILSSFIFLAVRLHSNWDGRIDIEQHYKKKMNEDISIFSDGLNEIKRVLSNRGAVPLYEGEGDVVRYKQIESPETLAWYMQARELFLLKYASYFIDLDDGWHELEDCWVGKNKKTGSLLSILCKHEMPSSHEIDVFVKYVKSISESKNIDQRPELYIALKSDNIVSCEQKIMGNIRICTESELISDLVDFSDYNIDINKKYEDDLLPDSGLTLSDTYTSSKIRSREKYNEIYLVEEFIEQWLGQSGEEHIAILGEYGQGKSTSALALAYKILHGELETDRIPIIITLRGRSPANETPEDLIASWARPYRINELSIMKLIEYGKIFVILEGFDEMAHVSEKEMRVEHFRKLWQFSFPKAKIMITGRPNLFLDEEETKVALGISKGDGGGPYCSAYDLMPFDLKQISNSLRKVQEKTKSEILSLADNDSKFLELASRPSVLFMIGQIWERESLNEFNGPVNSAKVMELFISHTYRRQDEKRQDDLDYMRLSSNERAYFMEGVAAYMSKNRLPNQISREEFGRVIEKLYNNIPNKVSDDVSAFSKSVVGPLRDRIGDVESPVEIVKTDVRTSGVLVHDTSKPGSLKFAHKSFMEFLSAKVIADFMGRKEREVSGRIMSTIDISLSSLMYSKESLSFYVEMLAEIMEAEEGLSFNKAAYVFSAVAGRHAIISQKFFFAPNMAAANLIAGIYARKDLDEMDYITFATGWMMLLRLFSGGITVLITTFILSCNFGDVLINNGFLNLGEKICEIQKNSIVFPVLVIFIFLLPVMHSATARKTITDLYIAVRCCRAASVPDEEIIMVISKRLVRFFDRVDAEAKKEQLKLRRLAS